MDKRERRPIGSEDLSYIDWRSVSEDFLQKWAYGYHKSVQPNL